MDMGRDRVNYRNDGKTMTQRDKNDGGTDVKREKRWKEGNWFVR